MGSDSPEGRDDRDDDDPDAPAVLPRKPKPSKLKALIGDAPAVASSLDDFITKANEGLLDVKDSRPTRETELAARVDELEKKLADVEARAKRAAAAAAAEPVMPVAPPSRGWGGMVIAFVLGCGAMFAVTTLLPKHEPEKTSVAPAPEPPTAVAAPTPAPDPAPVAAAPAPAPAPAPAATPDPTAPAPAAPTPAPVVAEKKITKSTPHPTKPVRPKPAEGSQNGSDTLYNPF